MLTFSKTLEVKSSKRTQSVDITSEIQKIISESGIKDGIITIFIPHTTCGVFINENWDPLFKKIYTLSFRKIYLKMEATLTQKGTLMLT